MFSRCIVLAYFLVVLTLQKLHVTECCNLIVATARTLRLAQVKYCLMGRQTRRFCGKMNITDTLTLCVCLYPRMRKEWPVGRIAILSTRCFRCAKLFELSKHNPSDVAVVQTPRKTNKMELEWSKLLTYYICQKRA